jgi:hypothetical protein
MNLKKYIYLQTMPELIPQKKKKTKNYIANRYSILRM